MAETYQKAVFNEGILIAYRLDRIQERINAVRVNPLAFNIEQNCYNYEVWFGNLCSLQNEAWSKLTTEERSQIENVRKMIEEALILFPPHIKLINEATNKKKVSIKYSNWLKVKPILDLFEKEIKIGLDKHGLANPDIEGGDYF